MIDEVDLVCIAASAAGRSPAELLACTDMAGLARVSAAAEVYGSPLEYASRLLLTVVREQPFPAEVNRGAAWLVAAFVLQEAGVRIRKAQADIVSLVAGLDRDTDLGQVMIALERIASIGGRRLACLCPSCGRELYSRERREGRAILVGRSEYELVGRCWYEHRAHDRLGRPWRAVDPELVGALP